MEDERSAAWPHTNKHKHVVCRRVDVSYNGDGYARCIRKDEFDMLELAPQPPVLGQAYPGCVESMSMSGWEREREREGEGSPSTTAVLVLIVSLGT
jgi:hypothetical protein